MAKVIKASECACVPIIYAFLKAILTLSDRLSNALSTTTSTSIAIAIETAITTAIVSLSPSSLSPTIPLTLFAMATLPL